MALQKHDELNRIAIPYEKYFGEMGLSEEEIERRISLAEDIDDIFILLFALISADIRVGNKIDTKYYIDFIVRKYEDVLYDFGLNISDKYPAIESHIIELAENILEQNVDDPDDDWNTSDDRAMAIAENDVNSICEYTRFQDAIDMGKTRKTWNTLLDNRVRKSHEELESVTIPIMDMFDVGDCKMYYPRDIVNGTAKETTKCRCWCTYA